MKCKSCGKSVGCGCNLDANGLCSSCRPKPVTPLPTPIIHP